MSTIHESPSSASPFLRRFDALWARLRRVQFGQSVVVWGLILLAAWTALITADFWLELSRGARMAGIVIAGGLAGLWAYLLWRQFRQSGTRPRTASEIERSFPQLGQSIRTTVQFGEATADQVRSAGVREALVSALEEETHARSRGLHLDTIVPMQRMWLIAAGLGTAVVALLVAMALNWEIRVAAARSLLAETPYSEVSVRPGNIKIDQGKPVEIEWTVSGRTDREIRLLTRPAGDPEAVWSQRDFTDSQATGRGHRSLTFATRLESVKKPIEYRVAAGPIESPVHRIDIRYPIALQRVEVELTPPAYTNHPPTNSEDPNITAVEGSSARFVITLDQPPRTASLVLNDLGRRDEDEMLPTTRTLPLEIDGTQLTAVLPLTGDMKYSIVAETSEGQRLPENTYRIRVRPDQAPEVYFEEPGDLLDVHTLAEVLMRIRVRDDFGLSRAGIIFEVNNEEEYPLLSEDFATAAEELKKLGKLTPDTQAALEKVLPLEFFQLKMTDSVAYYAFAEDNYPGTPHRSVTDLRFVDIRPFRIRYSVRDDDPAGMGLPGPKIATLEEVIKRQRFNLNRSMNVARRSERKEKIDLAAIDRLVTSESEIAQATRQLADFLGGLMVEELADEIQLLLQAEAHMLAAADSLSAGKYDTAVLQERDALKELIEGRNRLRMEIQKNPSKFRSLSAADRRLAQKLRRPKSDKQEAEEVVRRLKQLASAQEQVEAELKGSRPAEEGENGGGSEGDPQKAEPQVNPKPMPMEGAEPKAPADPKTSETEGKNDPQPSAKEEGEKPNEAEAPTKGEGAKSSAAETAEGAAGSPKTMSREELRDKQLDNVLEGQDLAKALEKLKNITDLAKGRMTEANKSLEGASAALDKGDTPGAIAESDRASETLHELARQVEALVKEEAAERLDEARQLAADLARKQQELAAASGLNGEMEEGEKPKGSPMSGQKGTSDPKDEMPPMGTPGQGTSDKSSDMPEGSGSTEKPTPGEEPKPGSGRGEATERPEETEPRKGQGGGGDSKEEDEASRGEALAQEAERNAEAGKTVIDILQSILKSTDPADKDVISKVESVLKDSQLDETVARMGGLPGQLRDGRLRDAKVTAADSADRWEATANKLAGAFREIAAPRLEELLEIEKQLQTLQDQLNNLQNEREVMEWHVAAGRLLDKVEELKADGAGMREKLEELMKQAGWSEEVDQFRLKGAGWVFDSQKQAIVAPEGYGFALRAVSREVQAHIQELLLGDLMNSKDEVTPPQYAALVERYYEILAKQKRPEAR